MSNKPVYMKKYMRKYMKKNQLTTILLSKETLKKIKSLNKGSVENTILYLMNDKEESIDGGVARGSRSIKEIIKDFISRKYNFNKKEANK